MTRAETSGAAAYLYCLLRRRTRPALTGCPVGLPGARRLRAVSAGERLWLILSDVPADRYSAERIETRLGDLDWLSACGLAHEAVVEHFMTGVPLVPLKMFTIFASEERAVRHVRRRRRHLDRLLDRVAGCREWGVRVVRDPARAPRGETEPPPSGTEFLRRKGLARRTAQVASTRDRRAADRMHRALRRHARAASRGDGAPGWSGQAAPLLQAAYLVEGGGAGFRSAARALARQADDDGYAMFVTGPWPPYHFVGARR